MSETEHSGAYVIVRDVIAFRDIESDEWRISRVMHGQDHGSMSLELIGHVKHLHEVRFEALKESARRVGAQHGKGTATWVFDGNTSSETYAQWLKWIDDGDTEMWNDYRDPLSGEYADDGTPRELLRWIDAFDIERDLTSEMQDELCEVYEFAHRTGWSDEIERVVRLQTQD
jgi:hypothetical protein